MRYETVTKYILLSVITLAVGFSQSVTISGVIKDSGTKKPLVGANVFIKETSLGTATIDNGSYKITNVNPGTYILKATYIGYDSKEVEIAISAGETLEQNLE